MELAGLARGPDHWLPGTQAALRLGLGLTLPAACAGCCACAPWPPLARDSRLPKVSAPYQTALSPASARQGQQGGEQ